MTGDAWNGHGFEISFAEPYDQTMIIQSIYAGGGRRDFMIVFGWTLFGIFYLGRAGNVVLWADDF